MSNDHYTVNPTSLRSGNLLKSTYGDRMILSDDDVINLNFKRECIMGKHLGFPLSDEILIQCFGFYQNGSSWFKKELGLETVTIEKRDMEYFIFGRKVEVAHILQGLVFFATGKELPVL